MNKNEKKMNLPKGNQYYLTIEHWNSEEIAELANSCPEWSFQEFVEVKV